MTSAFSPHGKVLPLNVPPAPKPKRKPGVRKRKVNINAAAFVAAADQANEKIRKVDAGIIAPSVNETCKGILRYLFVHPGQLTVGHPSSVADLTVAMTPAGYRIAVDEQVNARMQPEYKAAELGSNTFFAVHNLLDLGLVERVEQKDGE